MDRTILTRKSRELADRVVRIDAYLLEKFGFVRNKIYLKIDDYFVNCVPFSISLKGCKAISILGDDEVQFFQSFIERPHKLHVSLENPAFSRPVSVFFKTKILNIKKNNPESNVSIIDLSFLSTPNDFAEIFVTVVEEMERFRALHDDPESARQPADMSIFRRSGNDLYTTVKVSGWETEVRAKAVRLSPAEIEVFGDFERAVPQAEGAVELEFDRAVRDIYLKGTVTEAIASQEAAGFFRVKIAVDYSPAYMEALAPALPAGAPPVPTDDPRDDGASDST